MVKIIERDRVYVHAPVRRPPAHRPRGGGGGDHYGYIYDQTDDDSSRYDRRDDERPQVRVPDCGCDGADDWRDPR